MPEEYHYSAAKLYSTVWMILGCLPLLINTADALLNYADVVFIAGIAVLKLLHPLFAQCWLHLTTGCLQTAKAYEAFLAIQSIESNL